MAIITISRKLAALGDEIAQELAKKLDFRLVDKAALEERIKSYGFTDEKLQKYDEKRPYFWASLSQNRDDYLHFLKGAVFAEAAEGNAIFVGRGAGVILKDVPGVFSVFLAASPEIRVERVKSYFRCDENRARQIIEHSDNDREGFHRLFFETKWSDAGNYHLTLNTALLSIELCAEMVKFMRDKTLTSEAEERGAKRIEELVLGQKIAHGILYERKVPIHFLEVSVSGTQAVLYGVANSQPLIEAALASARELAPAATVHSEMQVVQEYTVMS